MFTGELVTQFAECDTAGSVVVGFDSPYSSKRFMSPIVPLTYYCLLVLGASIFGGVLPLWFRLTHRGMQVALSFVAAMMLGVGMLHMLPHALVESRASSDGSAGNEFNVMLWALGGWLVMF